MNCCPAANNNVSSSHRHSPRKRRFYYSMSRPTISTSPISNSCSTRFAIRRLIKGSRSSRFSTTSTWLSFYCDRLLLMEKGRIVENRDTVRCRERRDCPTSICRRVSKRNPIPNCRNHKLRFFQIQRRKQCHSLYEKRILPVSSEYVSLQATGPLKTLSSAVHNAGRAGTGHSSTGMSMRNL